MTTAQWLSTMLAYEKIWKAELARATEKLRKANITDELINRMVNETPL